MIKFRLKKKKVTEEGCKVIEAHYDTAKEWKMDKAGYFLIRMNPKTKKLEMGLCKKDNKIEIKIVGDSAEKIINTIIREKISEDIQHIGYLGIELAKLEIARELGIEYIQDDLLKLDEVKKWRTL